MSSLIRSVWRRSRSIPGLGAIMRFGDRVWWAKKVIGSGLVDTHYYCAQRGWRGASTRRVAWDYVGRGYRDGLSPNPLFDEVFAGGELPEVHRVPALYAYVVSDRATVRVNPWWDSAAYAARLTAEDQAAGPLEHLWHRRRGAVLDLALGDTTAAVPFAEFRGWALAAARTWARREDSNATEAMNSTVAVIQLVQQLDRRSDRKLTVLQRLAATEGFAPTAVFVRPSASQWISASVFGRLVPVVRVESRHGHASFAELLAGLSTQVSGEVLVAVDARAEMAVEDLRTLADCALEGAAVIPASRASDGTLAGVGAAHVGASRPWRILAAHPAEDLDAFGGAKIEVPQLTGRTFAAPLSAYRAAGGLDPRWGSDLPLEKLSLALSALPSPPPLRVLTGIRPVLAEPDRAFAGDAPKRSVGAEGSRADASLVATPTVEAIVRAAGFAIRAWEVLPGGDPEPRLEWLRPSPAAMRWAVKICAPAGRAGEVWGDTHFAHGLANALRRQGQFVVVDAFDARARPTSYLDDVSVVIRGPYRIDPPSTGVRIEWVISHPDEVTVDEMRRFDRVFAVSPKWAAKISEQTGLDVRPLLEATDADLFHPRGLPRGDEIVFVGTARGIPRPSVVLPLRAGIPVRVYGPDWRPFIPASAIVATSIPNSELSARYETASIVLNDHWPAMRREGFMAMRPFDVVASGGRVVSERVDGIEELFGGAVVVYDTEEELVDILRRDPADLFPADAVMAEISERIRSQESFDVRASDLLQAARLARNGPGEYSGTGAPPG